MGIDGLDVDDDFLTRERAALGDDAAQFSTPRDNAGTSANVQDDDDDLLGGEDSYGGDQTGSNEISSFESSFPAIDTRNEVCLIFRPNRATPANFNLPSAWLQAAQSPEPLNLSNPVNLHTTTFPPIKKKNPK